MDYLISRHKLDQRIRCSVPSLPLLMERLNWEDVINESILTHMSEYLEYPVYVNKDMIWYALTRIKYN